jgi:hypothetical protein
MNIWECSDKSRKCSAGGAKLQAEADLITTSGAESCWDWDQGMTRLFEQFEEGRIYRLVIEVDFDEQSMPVGLYGQSGATKQVICIKTSSN